MAIELLNKKSKGKSPQTKKIEYIPLKKDSEEQKEKSLIKIPRFEQYNALMKLRIVVSTIFLLCTVSLVLLFFGGWVISAILLLFGYIILFILMVELFRVKKL
jgi:hypothetical protein